MFIYLYNIALYVRIPNLNVYQRSTVKMCCMTVLFIYLCCINTYILLSLNEYICTAVDSKFIIVCLCLNLCRIRIIISFSFVVKNIIMMMIALRLFSFNVLNHGLDSGRTDGMFFLMYLILKLSYCLHAL